MDNVAWIAIGVSLINLAVIIVGRGWTASRTFLAKDDYDKDMTALEADIKEARAVIHRRIDEERAHNVRQDTAIHEGQLNYVVVSGLIESLRDCVKELKMTVREMRAMPHLPQCQVATHTPATPAGLTGSHDFSAVRRDPSASDLQAKEFVREQMRRFEREDREKNSNDA